MRRKKEGKNREREREREMAMPSNLIDDQSSLFIIIIAKWTRQLTESLKALLFTAYCQDFQVLPLNENYVVHRSESCHRCQALWSNRIC